MTLPYNPADVDSIAQFATRLVDKSFVDVVMEKTKLEDREKVIAAYGNMARKGGLGNLLEHVYFGYEENSNQEADFKEAGLELKVTPYELTSKGEMRAGERVVITMISYEQPFEVDFYRSHAWEKMRKMLLIYYWRNKKLNDNLLYKIKYVNVFTPPENDLAIIRQDYEIIKSKIMAGKAHELSEGDTLYLGACTKGSTAEKSLVPQYYNHTALAKQNVDMSLWRDKFESYVADGGRVLDAGCGSGRDSKAFIQHGYSVVAFDASREMCKEASELINQEVWQMKFQEIIFEDEFEGIWACASLLHVSYEELPDVMSKLHKALISKGIIYISFKYGDDKMTKGERFFRNFTETTIKKLLNEARFEVKECEITGDVREGRRDEKWVNVIAEKISMDK